MQDRGQLTSAVVGSGPKHLNLILGCIGDVDRGGVGDEKRCAQKRDLSVKIVVCKVHELVSGNGLVEVRWALSGAREANVGGRKGSFPHVSELVQDVRYILLVGHVIHEDHYTLLGKNHLGESGPLVETHGDVGRLVEVRTKSRLLQGTSVVANVNKVAVDNEDRDDIIRMRFDPRSDSL